MLFDSVGKIARIFDSQGEISVLYDATGVIFRKASAPPPSGKMPITVIFGNGGFNRTLSAAPSFNPRARWGNIIDPNTPSMNVVIIDDGSGTSTPVNTMRIGYPTGTADVDFPASITVTRAAVAGRPAYTFTTTGGPTGFASRGLGRQANYPIPAGVTGLSSGNIRHGDTVVLTIS